MKNHFAKFLFTSLAFCLLSNSIAQNINPAEDEIFKEFEVTRINVTLSDIHKQFLLAEENANSETYVPADVSFSNSALSNTTATNVGIRLRGNTARNHPKRSFKIDFKEFGGEQFFKYKKINLKPNVNDPSLVRELLTMHLYRAMDVPAPQVAPAILYFNDEYMGVYLMIEQIDDEFVDKRFGKEVGWLYKCSFSANLEDNGQVFNQDLYQSKMNESTDTRAELDAFVKVLKDTRAADFKQRISNVFAVDRYLRQLAVEAITGHWDGYSYLNNNYYLYYDEDDTQWEFIPYDTDNTWGIDWIDRDWATRDLTHFHRQNNARPLTTNILSVTSWEQRYYSYLNMLFEEYFTPDYLYPIFDRLESNLEAHVMADERFDDSFGFSFGDFKNAFQFSSIAHVEYGLRQFVTTRRATGIPTIPQVLTSVDPAHSFSVSPNPSNDGRFMVRLSDLADDQVKVTDMHGNDIPIRQTQVSTLIYQVDILSSPGMYILMVGDHYEKVVLR